MSLETVGSVYRNLQSKVPPQLSFIQSVETSLYESDVSSASDPIINFIISLEGARNLDVLIPSDLPQPDPSGFYLFVPFVGIHEFRGNFSDPSTFKGRRSLRFHASLDSFQELLSLHQRLSIYLAFSTVCLAVAEFDLEDLRDCFNTTSWQDGLEKSHTCQFHTLLHNFTIPEDAREGPEVLVKVLLKVEEVPVRETRGWNPLVSGALQEQYPHSFQKQVSSRMDLKPVPTDSLHRFQLRLEFRALEMTSDSDLDSLNLDFFYPLIHGTAPVMTRLKAVKRMERYIFEERAVLFSIVTLTCNLVHVCHHHPLVIRIKNPSGRLLGLGKVRLGQLLQTEATKVKRDDRECIVNVLAVSVPLKRYSQGKPQFGSLYIAMELADFGELDSTNLTVDAAVQTLAERMIGEDKKGKDMLKRLEKENEDLRSRLTMAMKEADFKTYQAETAERKVEHERVRLDGEKSAWEEERLRYRRDLKSLSGEKQVLLMERDTLAREVGDLKAQIDTLSQEVTRVIKRRSLEMEEVKAEQQREIFTLKEEIAKWQETARQAETACHKLKLQYGTRMASAALKQDERTLSSVAEDISRLLADMRVRSIQHQGQGEKEKGGKDLERWRLEHERKRLLSSGIYRDTDALIQKLSQRIHSLDFQH
ncbi:unnamed protein product [Darwinula stevensoni]|uniref:DUF3668 domain-containing protein n=1 Tax=Darwinula stevensoni TaxID=69355 RepID=A0A7R8XEF8_9CRUS|nr:unnamed protein product [Darwinula stevensoni]CAG0895760.1 unnamed protein product [Darwinula stevensoni]